MVSSGWSDERLGQRDHAGVERLGAGISKQNDSLACDAHRAHPDGR
jgi:hypothetical protein